MKMSTVLIRAKVINELINYYAYSQLDNIAGKLLDKHETWFINMVEAHGVTDYKLLAKLLDDFED